MRSLADNSIDSVVTDPPYELGFMGKGWDSTGIANNPALWAEVLRVLKPGGHVAAFSGTRTYHRMACAIEDSGFEVRDQIGWTYGSGFPKNKNCLKPAWEPICLARKPLSEKTVAANVLRWGTGAINVDGCRIESAGRNDPNWRRAGRQESVSGLNQSGWTSGLSARGDLPESLSDLGRFPANLCHDGSDEVLAAFPSPHGAGAARDEPGGSDFKSDKGWGNIGAGNKGFRIGDSGSAARFFYSAKASKDDRAGSKHPTVKPVKLMQWLVRLITPPGGTALDPFAGTGTTGEAAWREGFSAVLIEREAEYQADIDRRLTSLSGSELPLFSEEKELA